MSTHVNYDQIVATAYTHLWQRNCTKRGWCQHSVWRRFLEFHLKLDSKTLLRKIFTLLSQRGYFLNRRLTSTSHPVYLFVPEAILDDEARGKAIEYYRWHSAWSKGWNPAWNQSESVSVSESVSEYSESDSSKYSLQSEQKQQI